MKSEALQYLEERLAIGHINIQEFSALHDLLAGLGRLARLLKRTYSGEIDWDSGAKLIAEEAADARKHLESFHQLYSHTAADCERQATSQDELDPTNPYDRQKVKDTRAEFKNDIERLPGTRHLFENISAHFDDNIYHVFLESHRRHPSHRIWELNTELTGVYIAMTELYDLISTAEEWASKIDKTCRAFNAECHRTRNDHAAEGVALKHSEEALSRAIRSADPPLPKPCSEAATRGETVRKKSEASYDTPSHPYGIGQSFSAVEEIVHRRHNPVKANYTTYDTESTVSGPSRFGSRPRRNAPVIPRIFTGSFSELEENIRKLRMPKSEVSPIPQTATTDPNALVEPITTPVSSVAPLSSGTNSGLRRREALIERDVEFQDRVINGGVIRSRRPSDRVVVEDRSPGHPLIGNETLTRWLNEPAQDSREPSPTESRKETTF